MAGLLAVFAEFERDLLGERVRAGIAHARQLGKPHGRPNTTGCKAAQAKAMFNKGYSKSKISKGLGISRTSVRRLLLHQTILALIFLYMKHQKVY